MKRNRKLVLLSVWMLLAAGQFAVISQAETQNQSLTAGPEIKKTSAYKHEIRMKQELELEYTVSDPYAAVTFASSDPAVVSVDESGTATGLKPGFSIVTASVEGGNSDKWRITVRKPRITIDGSYKIKMKVGETVKLKYKDTGEGAAVTFTTADKKVKLSKDGDLTAIKPGVSEVFASIAYGNTVKWRIETSKPKLTLIGDRIIKFKVGSKYTVKFSDTGENVPITFESSDPEVASVNEKGVVTALKKGKSTVYASIENGNTIKWTFHVKEAPVISKTSVTLEEGESIKLKVSGTTKTPFWRSANMRTAIVSENGVVTGRNVGTTTITAKVGTLDLTVMSCKVKVKKASSRKPDIKAKIDGTENSRSKWVSVTITNNGTRTLRIYSKGASVSTGADSKSAVKAVLYSDFDDRKVPRTFIDIRSGDSDTFYFCTDKAVTLNSSVLLTWNCVYDLKDYDMSIRFGSKKVNIK